MRRGPCTTKSCDASSGGTIFGRIPEYPGCNEPSLSPANSAGPQRRNCRPAPRIDRIIDTYRSTRHRVRTAPARPGRSSDGRRARPAPAPDRSAAKTASGRQREVVSLGIIRVRHASRGMPAMPRARPAHAARPSSPAPATQLHRLRAADVELNAAARHAAAVTGLRNTHAPASSASPCSASMIGVAVDDAGGGRQQRAGAVQWAPSQGLRRR